MCFFVSGIDDDKGCKVDEVIGGVFLERGISVWGNVKWEFWVLMSKFEGMGWV